MREGANQEIPWTVASIHFSDASCFVHSCSLHSKRINSCEQQCIWRQDLQVIGWMEELAILSSTSSFLHVVVARHNPVADGERETEGGWNHHILIQTKSISIGIDFHELHGSRYLNIVMIAPMHFWQQSKGRVDGYQSTFFWNFLLFHKMLVEGKIILDGNDSSSL